MIYSTVVFYFLCGLGVALALDDDNLTRSHAILWFLLTLCLWPLMFTFTITMAAKKVAESNALPRPQTTATKEVTQ